jgi:hypothetical protein
MRLEICVNCKHLGAIVGGRFRCGVDGEPIQHHADTGVCPKGKFSDVPSPASPLVGMPRLPLAGDLVAAMTERVGIDRLAKFASRIAGKDCGCSERREWLNRLDRRIRQRFG